MAKISFGELNPDGIRKALRAEREEREAKASKQHQGIQTAKLTKTDEGYPEQTMIIRFCPRRERLIKEIRENGKIVSRGASISGDERRYRVEIKNMVKWGWTVVSSD